ncbi:MAG: cupin [Rhodospirillaceae bacterium]|nr:cupin [Rhodospirillaceae bacterium]MBT3628826.1 cupin [Rhodospirillaceae bacterium]MBT3926235.1 cupin [Rhodospirillaceae bacterium]MBT4427186.1 cupin [Rhodospirillaceae bacterium]MBT5676753.1 cupin [Rhodospirillaceae bacterium]
MSEYSAEPCLLSLSGDSPNNDALPLLLYRGAVALGGDTPESDVEKVFWANGWGNGFRGDTFPFHHYHSIAHEVVGVARGTAQIQFGGPDGPVFDVQAGDAVLIPAGVVHCRLDNAPGFMSIGAYPPGQSPDLCVLSEDDARIARQTPEVGGLEIKPTGQNDLAAALARIKAVALPETDPIGGKGGPMATHWRHDESRQSA